MGQEKKVLRGISLTTLAILFSSCGNMFDLGLWGDGDDASSLAAEAIEAASTYAVALGGTAKGRDELVIYDSSGRIADFAGRRLEFETSNNNIELRTRDGYTDFSGGSGALIVPKNVGTTIVTYKIDGMEQEERYKVIVPPQSLIQILLGEARGQIADEAQRRGNTVELSSESPTASAVGAVVRNRVLLLEAGYPLSLFVVDGSAWNAGTASAHWDAVITAGNGNVYQFSPVDPETLSHDLYLAASNRDNLLDDSELIAYDQALLTAAGIFTNNINDPTGGAFAFRTPTIAQAECLAGTLAKGLTVLPPECGPGDENFPAFAPVQILIHPSTAKLDDGRPSFVFYRNRNGDEPAVTNAP